MKHIGNVDLQPFSCLNMVQMCKAISQLHIGNYFSIGIA